MNGYPRIEPQYSEKNMTRSTTCVLLCIGFASLGAREPAKSNAQESAERKLVELTNQERKKADLPALQLNPTLSKIARAHAENMARQGKMEHVLDKKGPLDRVRDAGYRFTKAGENIAFGEEGATAVMIMKAWMESKDHRANILLPEYTETGLGIARDKSGDLWYAQVFAKPRAR
jgi:uncharacterized protein YkwD